MSVINQVLKDLDRQGTDTRTPRGVIAVNQVEAATPRWPVWFGGLAIVLAAAWWFRPASPVSVSPAAPAPALPQLRLSQQLSPLSEPAPLPVSKVTPAPERKPAPVHVGRKSVAPSAIHAHSAEDATLFRPTQAVVAVIPATKPRLDTRLSEIGKPAVEARPSVVKEIKPLTPQVQAEDAWRQASRLLEQGRNHDARESLENVLRLDPSHAAARQSLVALMLETGDNVRGETLLREGLALQPNDPWYPRSLAQLQLQRGDFSQAAAILKTALSKRADATNWALYAGTQSKLGKPAESAHAYREALRLDPAQGNWWLGMAVALEQSGDKADAGAAYQRALQTRLSGELREFAQQKARELGAR